MTETDYTDSEIVGELHYKADITTAYYEEARVKHFREGVEVPAAFGGGRR